MTRWRYRIYGLHLASDAQLVGLDLDDSGAPADLTVHWGQRAPLAASVSWRPRYISEREDGGPPALIAEDSVDQRWLRLHYTEGVTFVIDAAAEHLWCEWTAPMTVEDAMTFLLGPVLGYALRQRGVLALHASAVVMSGVAVAFVGPGGAGKSTIAAALGRAGYPVLTDDVLALRCVDSRWVGWPAYDHLRLWSESETLLFGSGGRLRPLTPTWDKLSYPFAEHATPRSLEPVPLGALLLLGDREDGDTAPRLEPLTTSEAFIALSENSYGNYLLNGQMRRNEFEAIASLVRGVRMHRWVPREDRDSMAGSVRFIVERFLKSPGLLADLPPRSPSD